MPTLVEPPFPIFYDVDGMPLEDGYIYIGIAGLNPQANPIQAYWDAAMTVPAAQPIRTKGGYPVLTGTPKRLYVPANYSILVKNKNSTLIYSNLDSTDYFNSPSGGVVVKVDTIAELRNLVPSTDEGYPVQVQGYYAIGDGGGGPARFWDSASVAADNGGSVVRPTAIGVGDPGRWKWAADGLVPIEAWGARGDGTTDDSSSITNALSASEVGVPYFTKTYKCENVFATVAFSCALGSKFIRASNSILYACITLNAGASVDNIEIDGKYDGINRAEGRGLAINADKIHIKSVYIHGFGAFTLAGVSSNAMRIDSDNVKIDSVLIEDCINTGATNKSQPNACLINGVNNDIALLQTIDCQNALYMIDGKSLHIGTFYNEGSLDNTVYGAPSLLEIDTLIDYGLEEGLVVGGTVHVGEYFNSGPFVNINGTLADLSINTLHFVKDLAGNLAQSPVVVCRAGAVIGNVNIGSIDGSVEFDLFANLSSAASIGYVSIRDVNLIMKYKDFNNDEGSWMDFTLATRIDLQNINVRCIDCNTWVATEVFIRVAPTLQSSFENVNVSFFLADESAAPISLRGSGMFSDKIYTTSLNVRTVPSLRIARNNERPFVGHAEGIPASGYWRKGSIIFNNTHSASNNVYAWFCVAEGTPGTWRPIAGFNLGASYTVTNGLVDRSYNADTVTVGELADVVYTLLLDLEASGLIDVS